MLWVQEYGGVGCLWNDTFEGNGGVYQIQIEHEAYPTITYMFLDNFRAFLAEKHKTDAEWPGTLRDFEVRSDFHLEGRAHVEDGPGRGGAHPMASRDLRVPGPRPSAGDDQSGRQLYGVFERARSKG